MAKVCIVMTDLAQAFNVRQPDIIIAVCLLRLHDNLHIRRHRVKRHGLGFLSVALSQLA